MGLNQQPIIQNSTTLPVNYSGIRIMFILKAFFSKKTYQILMTTHPTNSHEIPRPIFRIPAFCYRSTMVRYTEHFSRAKSSDFIGRNHQISLAIMHDLLGVYLNWEVNFSLRCHFQISMATNTPRAIRHDPWGVIAPIRDLITYFQTPTPQGRL